MPSPPFPIVLSPPPLEAQQQQQGVMPELMRPQERQQSVGFNLQHEFETLNADLDLDLNQSESLLGSNYPVASRPATSFLREASPASGMAGFKTQGSSSYMVGTHGFLPRPHSVHQDFGWSSLTPFHQDLMTFTQWIENLSPHDTITMVDHLCNVLPQETLSLFRMKLQQQGAANQAPIQAQHPSSLQPTQQQQQQQQHQHQQQQQQPQYNSPMVQPVSGHQHPSLQSLQPGAKGAGLDDMFDKLSLQPRYDHLQQPKPKHKFDKLEKSRPRSADPHTRLLDRRSPTTHLYEKTSFLQAAASHQGSGQVVPDDLSTQLKLGALATINSRVALDSRKGFRYEQQQQIGRFTNSSSVPPKNTRGIHNVPAVSNVNGNNNSNNNNIIGNNVNTINSNNNGNNNSGNGNGNSNSNGNNNGNNNNNTNSNNNNNINSNNPLDAGANNSGNGGSSSTTGTEMAPSSSMPSDIANPELLKNIPAWLKLLRLHKYTDCLKDIPWRELIELDDGVLEEKGVKALGARRKLLKAFDAVKQNIK